MLPEKSLQIIKTRSQTLKALLELNNKAKEVKILEILKELPSDDDAYYLGYLYGLLIDLYLKQGEDQKVIAYVNKLILISGMALYEYTGNNSPFSKDKLQSVINCYLSEQIVGNYSLSWGKGRILQLKNEYADAISFFKLIIKHDNKNLNAYRMLARVYEEINDYKNANLYFQKAEAIQKDPLTECMMATIAIDQYQYEKAESVLQNTIKNFPKYSFARYRLIEVLGKLNKTEEQERQRKQLLQKYPGNTKYILHTILNYDGTTLNELNELQEALKDGIDYTSVNQFLGNYYYISSASVKTKEKLDSVLSKSILFYEQAIKNNKYCYQAYTNQIKVLMMKTRNLVESKEEDNNKRLALIESLNKTFPFAVEDYVYYKFADSTLDEQIKNYSDNMNKYPEKVNFYCFQANNFLVKLKLEKDEEQKKEHQNTLFNHCTKMMNRFPSSAAIFFDCFIYFQELETYDIAEKCIKRCIELSENNTDIQIIAQKLNFYKEPASYNENLKKTESEFANKINENFYRDLALFYYNKIYEYEVENDTTSLPTINYSEVSLELLEKALQINADLLKTDTTGQLRLIYSLLLFSNKQEKKAFSIYNLIDEDQVSLLLQIKICWDILDINFLYKLYIQKHEDKDFNKILFWSTVLLYFLRYNLFEDQKEGISHYTSLKALKSMLSDTEMSSFRLCSLGSANDPKEGKIIYDFLTQNLNDKELYENLIDVQSNNHTAVQASFTKLEDALTMFRLYGKENKNEDTGVNLVFNDNFFSEKLKTPVRIKKQEKNFKKNNSDECEDDLGEALYWILYWDQNNEKMYFNPQGVYKTLEIDLNDNQTWYVLNQGIPELSQTPDSFYSKYAKNIAYILNQLKIVFQASVSKTLLKEEINKIKEQLLNISYLIKDVAFYDEKELRIIQVLSLQDSSLKHIDDYYTLYKEYAKLSGLYRYPKICPLNKIIIGPKIEQKETLREYLINHLEKAGMNSVAVEFSKAPLA